MEDEDEKSEMGSFLAPLDDPEQPALFLLPNPHAVDAVICQDGRYTAERLFLRRPDVYRMIVHLLSEKQSIRAIKRACRVHHETIAAVAEREKVVIDTGKERVLSNLRLAQHLLAETLVEDIIEGRIKPDAKALALAIVTDKVELLSGGVTARIETTSGNSDAPKSWDEWLTRMKRADAHDTGLVAGEDGQRARVHRLGAGGLAGVVEEAGTDVESDALPEQSGVDTGSATAGDSGSAEGGGGGPEGGTPGIGSTHPPA